MKNLGKILFTFVVSLALVEPAVAAESTVNAETQYVFNTFLFLVCGFLVMFMAPGFAMLECGLVTSRSVSTIAAKNIGLYSIAGIMFWLVGYNLAYGIPEGGYMVVLLHGVMDQKLIQVIQIVLTGGFKWYFAQQLHLSFQEH